VNTTSNIRRNARRGAAALVIGGAAAAALSMPANAASTDTWDKLAECESGGSWDTNTGNGFSGGLQFTPSTWSAFGGSGSPEGASKAEQISVAEKVLEGQGWGAWPSCSSQLGLGEGDKAGTASVADSAPQQQEQTESVAPQSSNVESYEAPAQAEAPAQPAQAEAPAPAEAAAPVQESYEAPAQAEAPAAPAQAAAGEHTVAAGETISSIAAQYGVSWEDLASANGTVVSDPNLIFPGQVLEIPAA
jgi:LysM repeat protein